MCKQGVRARCMVLMNDHCAVSDLPVIARNEHTKQPPVAGSCFNKIASLAVSGVMPPAALAMTTCMNQAAIPVRYSGGFSGSFSSVLISETISSLSHARSPCTR